MQFRKDKEQDVIEEPTQADYLALVLRLRQSLSGKTEVSVEESFLIAMEQLRAVGLQCAIVTVSKGGRTGWKRFSGVEAHEDLSFSLDEDSISFKSLLAGSDICLASFLQEARPKGCLEDWLSGFHEESGTAFPIVHSGMLKGILLIACQKGATSENLKTTGHIVVSDLALGFAFQQEDLARRIEKWLFTLCPLPVFLMDRKTDRLLKVNKAVEGVFPLTGSRDKTVNAVSVLSLVESVVGNVSEARPLVFSRSDLLDKSVKFEAAATFLVDAHLDQVCVILIPSGFFDSGRIDFSQIQKNKLGNKSHSQADFADSISKQLVFERFIRQVISRLHSSLDMNSVLQLLVDNVGQCLSSSRCLAVRSELAALPVVTHEYAEPSISPLGLGRTARFPSSVVARFRNGPVAIDDVTSLRSIRSIPSEDISSLLDSGISSLAGAPIVSHGSIYGVVIALEMDKNRHWSESELELIRVAAGHASVALEHCHAYQQIKDQLFHTNLLGNLTKQLNNSLEMVNRRSSVTVEKSKKSLSDGDPPPLSVRELEVLKLIASGLSNKEIASRLFLTASTVELHASRIRKKLELRSRTALVKYACDNGLA